MSGTTGSSVAGCAAFACPLLRWSPMAAAHAPTSAGTAVTYAHAPVAGPSLPRHDPMATAEPSGATAKEHRRSARHGERPGSERRQVKRGQPQAIALSTHHHQG